MFLITREVDIFKNYFLLSGNFNWTPSNTFFLNWCNQIFNI